MARGARGLRYSYEIQTDPAEVGLLLRVGGDSADAVAATSDAPRRCWEQLEQRLEPCLACPIIARRTDELPMVLPDARAPGAIKLVNARWEGSVAHVDVWVVDDRFVARLIAVRMERLVRGAGLTLRERRVLDLLLLGSQAKEIALQLGISPRTVKFHSANIFRKLGADSRQDFLRTLLRPSLPPPEERPCEPR